LQGTGISLSDSLENLAKATALKRLATVEDVVNTIMFLASESAAGITGQLIPVDCGVY
jgi:enoyl-[acyl-carrier-protein] reductase (NADH)